MGSEEELAVIMDPLQQPNSLFGTSIELSQNELIIGSFGDPGAGPEAGSAYVFDTLEGVDWNLQTILEDPAPAAGRQFGSCVAIEKDTIAVRVGQTGEVVIYDRDTLSPRSWNHTKTITGIVMPTSFLKIRNIHLDNDTLVVLSEGYAPRGIDFSVPLVFERNLGGPDNWGLAEVLLETGFEEDSGYLTWGVAIHGNRIVASRFLAFTTDVYTKSALGNWELSKSLPSLTGYFDSRVDIYNGQIAAGVKGQQGTNYFGAVAFALPRLDTWSDPQRYYNNDPSIKTDFCQAVGMHDNYAVATASEGDSTVIRSGAAYVYERDLGGAGNWGYRKAIHPSAPAAEGGFGWSVDVSQNFIALGANKAGSVHIFDAGPFNGLSDVRITSIDIKNGEACIEVSPALGDKYYLLWSSDLPDGQYTGEGLYRGDEGHPPLFRDFNPEDLRMFRVEMADLNNPGDIDQDGANDLLEHTFRPYRDAFDGTDELYVPPPAYEQLPELTAVANQTIRGLAWPGTELEIHGLGSAITATPASDGTFSVPVTLHPNRLNRISLSVTDPTGARSPAQVMEVTHDQQAPTLHIDFPTHNSQVFSETATIAGRVGDALSGYEGLHVMVNGQQAAVNVGIGPNGTFERPSIPLVLGQNVITVSAQDVHGNEITKSINLFRQDTTDMATIQSVAGNGQIGTVLAPLPSPAVVELRDASGNPLVGKEVEFRVIRSDGRLSNSPSPMDGSMRLTAITDSSGRAQAYWRLGADAGCGNNRLEVSADGITGSTYFCASGNPGPATQINVGSGNTQVAQVNTQTMEPLRAWVSDSCNGISGVPVTFTVTQGGGKVNGQSSVTIPTIRTGHAEVRFQLGRGAGNHVVEASYAGYTGSPAVFTTRGIEANSDLGTSFTAITQDNAGSPIGGAVASIVIGGVTTGPVTSNVDGVFTITNIPSGGFADLYVSAKPATLLSGMVIPPNSFPKLHFQFMVVENAENNHTGPILFPRLNPENEVYYDGTYDVVLRCERIDGLEMTVKAGSMTRPDGSKPSPSDPEYLSINQVHHDDIPMPMPDGANPPFAWTFQPGGATFDPPVAVRYPNMSGLPPGAAAYFLTYDHAIEQFLIVASGTVSEDGAVIGSDNDSGLTLSGWGCNCPPYSVTSDCCEDSDCKKCDENGDLIACSHPKNAKGDQAGECECCENQNESASCFTVLPEDLIFFQDFRPAFKPVVPLEKLGSANTSMIPFENIPAEIDYCYLSSKGGFTPVLPPIKIFGAIRDVVVHYDPEGQSTPISAPQWRTPTHPLLRPNLGPLAPLPEQPADFGLGSLTEGNYCGIVEQLQLPPPRRGEAAGLGSRWYSLEGVLGHELDHIADHEAMALSVVREFQNKVSKIILTPPEGECELNPILKSAAKSKIETYRSQAIDKFLELRNAYTAAHIDIPNQNTYEEDHAYIAGQAYDTVVANSIVQLAADLNWASCTPNTAGRGKNDIGGVLPHLLSAEVTAEKMILNFGENTFLRITGLFSDGTTLAANDTRATFRFEVLEGSTGSVNSTGMVSGQASGTFWIRTSILEGGLATFSFLNKFTVKGDGDLDGDEIPDEWEITYGLSTNNPADAEEDWDSDGLSNLEEYRFGSAPTDQDTDGDGINDGLEYQAGDNPNEPPRLGPDWTVRIDNQLVVPNSDGSFVMSNISSPGQTVNGLPPDLISDNPVQLTASRLYGGQILYARSSPFYFSTGWFPAPSNLEFGLDPFIQPENIRIFSQQRILSYVGETLQLLVFAESIDGLTADVTAGSWSQYTSSNPDIINVDSNGQCTAISEGFVYITVRNLGAVSTVALEVIPGETSTEILGFVNFPNGSPAPGVNITAFVSGSTVGQSTVSESDGSFRIVSMPTSQGDFRITADIVVGSELLFAQLGSISPTPGTTLIQAPITLEEDIELNPPRTINTAGGATLAVKPDGSLWTWGWLAGHLGGVDFEFGSTVPVQVGTRADWRGVSASQTPFPYNDQYALCLRADGTLWAFGSGKFVAGEERFLWPPEQIGTESDWATMCAGVMGSLAIKRDGSLWAWGSNSNQLFGSDHSSDLTTYDPVLVDAGPWKDVAISSGGLAVLAISLDGKLWGWGQSIAANPLPSGSGSNWKSLRSDSVSFTLLKEEGSLFSVQTSMFGGFNPEQIGTESDWQKIDSKIGIKTDGSVWAWRGTFPQLNSSGNIGFGYHSEPARVSLSNQVPVDVASGSHYLSFGSTGTLIAFGEGGAEMGIGSLGGSSGLRPIQGNNWSDFGEVNSVLTALDSGGRIFRSATFGGLPDQPVATNNIWQSIYADGRLGLDNGGVLWQLEPEPTNILSTGGWKKIVAPLHSLSLRPSSFLGIKDDNTLWAWGDNRQGEAGIGNTSTSAIPLTLVDSRSWKDVAYSGRGLAFGILSDNTLWAWGTDEGAVNLLPLQIDATTEWQSLATTDHWDFDWNIAYGLDGEGSAWRWFGFNASSKVLAAPGVDIRSQEFPPLMHRNFIFNTFFYGISEDGRIYTDTTSPIYYSPSSLGSSLDNPPTEFGWEKIRRNLDGGFIALRNNGRIYTTGYAFRDELFFQLEW